MNEKLSALIDGELDHEDAVGAIKQLASDNTRRESWDAYHLIGEVMRGETAGAVERRRCAANAIFAKLADEPTVLAPGALRKVQRVETRTRMAIAMAASVVTVSAIAVVAFKQQGGVVAPVQMVTASPVVAASRAPAQSVRVNDYLAIHRQFSNPGAFQAATLRAERARVAGGN
jgi:sigma-E factor negative regulatory protein RseA